MTERPLVLAITACPTGIAHTYMAAEKLQEAAGELGYEIAVETHGSIGVEHAFSEEDLRRASGVVVASDKQIDLSRFAGLPLVSTPVADGIHRPKELLAQALSAPPAPGDRDHHASARSTEGRNVGAFLYKALMNGVSHMIPFVVAGGLLIAVALAVGGTPTAEGLQIEPGTFWDKVNQIGVVAFGLMIPALSGFIASAIADRPGLAPGMITGLIANTGALYGADGGAGFIGAIITGFLSGFIALGLKKIPVHKYVAPIMPIIVIPVVTTLAVGLLFIYVAGAPIAAAFAALSSFLMSLQGGSVLILGAIIGAMIAFDLGGPVNKTAFLFGGGLIAAGNAGPMGMAAAAIAVPPLAMGALTLVRRKMFNAQERESGIAALFMGFFGITEGAIPFAASRPLQVIPANVLGGAVAGALAAGLAVKDNVMHGGPIVAVLGAVENVAGFSAALLAGVVVTVVVAMLLIRWGTREENLAPAAHADTGKEPVLAGATAAAPSLAGSSTTAHAVASRWVLAIPATP